MPASSLHHRWKQRCAGRGSCPRHRWSCPDHRPVRRPGRRWGRRLVGPVPGPARCSRRWSSDRTANRLWRKASYLEGNPVKGPGGRGRGRCPVPGSPSLANADLRQWRGTLPLRCCQRRWSGLGHSPVRWPERSRPPGKAGPFPPYRPRLPTPDHPRPQGRCLHPQCPGEGSHRPEGSGL